MNKIFILLFYGLQVIEAIKKCKLKKMYIASDGGEQILGDGRHGVGFLVELMQRFMMPKENESQDIKNKTTNHADFMQELETMRLKAKAYFLPDLEYENVWGENMDEKYSSFG